MQTISNVIAREVLDSRGNPTVEVEIHAGDVIGRSIVPSGASTGAHEALELRDGDSGRYLGKGVQKAVSHVNTTLKDVLIDKEVEDLLSLDDAMIAADGTENKDALGANALLGCSMALRVLKAKLQGLALVDILHSEYECLGGSHEKSLPVPYMNVVNGGEHADNPLDFQEFMIVPHAFDSFAERLRAGAEVYHHLKKLLQSKGLVTAVGDEGGFAPDVSDTRAVVALLGEAVESAGYKLGEQISIAMDVAATEMYEDGMYSVEGKSLSSAEMVDLYESLIEEFPIVSIEDGLDEDDFEGWKLLTERIGDKVQLVGDDLFVTNKKRLAMGTEGGMANAILIKLNQIGTVKETLEVIVEGEKNGFKSMISHRSGETEDTFIADLVVACGTGQIKSGAPCRTDRVAKYNQLLRLEESL